MGHLSGFECKFASKSFDIDHTIDSNVPKVVFTRGEVFCVLCACVNAASEAA